MGESNKISGFTVPTYQLKLSGLTHHMHMFREILFFKCFTVHNLNLGTFYYCLHLFQKHKKVLSVVTEIQIKTLADRKTKKIGGSTHLKGDLMSHMMTGRV